MLMDKKKSIYILLLIMLSVFSFRFDFLKFIFTLANQSELVRSFAPQYLPYQALKYFNLYHKSEKNTLVGSSVFYGYLTGGQYYKSSFFENFEQYARLNESYLQFLNEMTLIQNRSGKNIIFFLQPGELSLPIEDKPVSWLVQPIDVNELMLHIKLLKSFYNQYPNYTSDLNLMITRIIPEFLFHRSKADSFFYSGFVHHMQLIQNAPFSIYRYTKLYIPQKKEIKPYSESLYQFDDQVQVVTQGDSSLKLNLEYMKFYLKKLLTQYDITFVELPYSQRCENSSTLETRSLWLSTMSDLSKDLDSKKFKFIQKDELPTPPDVIFKDCIHISLEYMTSEKYNYLKIYFETLSKKLNLPELQI
jgi:hypothetical protein